MKLFISGASGYLGSRLVEFFYEQYDVYLLIRASSNKKRIELWSDRYIYVDNEYELECAFETHKPDYVINTAALYGRNEESVTEMVSANVRFPTKLIELAVKYQCKAFVHTGTSLPEDISLYSYTKHAFSKVVSFLEIKDTRFVNVQLEHFYGPKDDNKKFITYVIEKCIKGEDLDLTMGCQERDFIHINDVLSAYETILENIEKMSSRSTLELGSGEVVKISDIVRSIHRISRSRSKLNFGAIPMRDNEIHYSCANIEVLKSLGWTVNYSLEKGISEAIGDILDQS